MSEVVVVSAVRTPIGKFQGSLQSYTAPKLGAVVVREAVKRAGVEPAQVDEAIMGCVLQAGVGQSPARQAAIFGGLPPEVGAVTINQVCGSGLRAVSLASQAVQTGDSQIVVAGGMESMSNAPYLLPQARTGYRMGNGTLVDAMINDGLWDVYNQFHMGAAAEMVAEKYNISREDQDAFAAESHRRAAAATSEGRFKAQIVPVEVASAKKGEAPRAFDTDESIRPDTTKEILAKLKPAFKQGGTVTAGNAPGVSDGAAAVMVTSAERAKELGLKPMVVIRAQAQASRAPEWFSLAPIDAVRRVAEKAGWPIDSVDLFELNEAFSVQALAVIRELNLDMARVNVNGGAVALGHPIGASGAAVLVKLIYAMADRRAKRGIASLCLGGGSAVALAVESV